jgi:hypothetical protein
MFGDALGGMLDPLVKAKMLKAMQAQKNKEEEMRLAGENAEGKKATEANPFGELQTISAQQGDMVNPFAVSGNGMQMTPEMLKFAPFLMGGSTQVG